MSIYDTLNEKQKEAVLCTEGPLLILAGAGSGKTRVLTHRVAYLIEEKNVNPWNILAITFTNKAAGEMRDRVDRLVSFGAEGVWVSTFHAMCVRILRRYAHLIGYDNNFTIYDTDDQKTLMKDVCKRLNVDTKMFKERMLLSEISHAKNELVSVNQYKQEAGGNFAQRKIGEVYEEYERELIANNAMDFDDLLLCCVDLFQTQPDVLDYYQERFRYIMVDEYQDTNSVQFELIRLLSMKYRNLCVVGDDDQSIYKFRGANIRNILDFESVFEDATVIKLEQNYRSTSHILNAANAVIRNNKGRKDKTLWTDNGEGDAIEFRQFDNAYDEADFVVEDIKRAVRRGEGAYSDHAVLYRTNAQSRMFEEKCIAANLPYKVVGGVNFYSRREIKDVLAYLKTIDNGKDDLAVRRIINVPKRGIGATTINRVQEYAIDHEESFYQVLTHAKDVPGIGRGVTKLAAFADLIEEFKHLSENLSLLELAKRVLDETGYIESLQAEGLEEAESRIENVDELLSKVAAFEEACEDNDEPATLSRFLEEVALVADIDSLEENSDYVILMTLHAAKGLEFPHVYLVGMEDGLFPSYMTITADDPEEVEEERRLCYVGITRAKEKLTITCARRRMVRGETQFNKLSRFVKEIPGELLRGLRPSVSVNNTAGGISPFGSTAPFESGSSFSQKKRKPYANPYVQNRQTKQFGTPKTGGLSYQVGDRVRHVKFGVGTVTQIVSGGRDYEVTVNFDTAGTKKMFAAFAKLEKV